MTIKNMTHTAALFYKSPNRTAVPLKWLERASELFGEYRLSPILFTADGSGFVGDDCFILGPQDAEHVRWGELLRARRSDLVEALRCQSVFSLHMDVPLTDAEDRAEWRALASTSSFSQEIVLGFNEDLVPDPASALRRAFRMAQDLFEIHYGFGYTMPLEDIPDCYASGIARSTFNDFREWLRQRSSGSLPPKSADEQWHDELCGEKRHLTGLFRGAYSANLLSESHVQGADLQAAGLGVLSDIGPSLWLWELSPTEIPQAESWLETKGVLVRQHRPQ